LLEHLQQCSKCDLAKIFFTSKFSYLLFFAGTANWGTTNSKPPGPIIMMDQSSETLSSSQILFYYTLFYRCIELMYLLPATANGAIIVQSKPNSWAKPAHFDSSSSNFFLCSVPYWVSNAGDALTWCFWTPFLKYHYT
jgi:hypothetical protein